MFAIQTSFWERHVTSRHHSPEPFFTVRQNHQQVAAWISLREKLQTPVPPTPGMQSLGEAHLFHFLPGDAVLDLEFFQDSVADLQCLNAYHPVAPTNSISLIYDSGHPSPPSGVGSVGPGWLPACVWEVGPTLGGSASSAKPGFKMKAEAAGAGPALALPFFGPVGRGGWVAVALRSSDEALQGYRPRRRSRWIQGRTGWPQAAHPYF